MIRRDNFNVKLPHISTTSSESVAGPSNGKKFGYVDFDFHNCRQNSKDLNHEKTTFWKSAQYSGKKEEHGTSESYIGRRMNQEKAFKATKLVDYTCYCETKSVLPLRRHNSEPLNLLQRNDNPFSVKATTLKLNQREKEKNASNVDKKKFDDLLPSVFFDTTSDRRASENAKEKHKRKKTSKNHTESFRSSDKNISGKSKPSKDNTDTIWKNGSGKEHARNDQKVTKSDIDHDSDKPQRKPLKSLPKRRLSEQIGSYEINRNNHNAFPRKITIRTSKSCPLIVIHECGEYEETSNDSSSSIVDSVDNVSKESSSMNGCKTLNKDTTSFVPYWKPKQSIAKAK